MSAGSQEFHRILQELGAMHDRKQQDYGRPDDPFANVRSSEDFGIPAWVGAMVRANDKVKRIQKAADQVVHGYDVDMANESLEDSFIDLAVYAVIGLVLFRETVDPYLAAVTKAEQTISQQNPGYSE